MEGESETTFVKDGSVENITSDPVVCGCSRNTDEEVDDSGEETPCTCPSQTLDCSSTVSCTEKRPVPKKRIHSTNYESKKPKLRTSKDVYDRLKWNSKSVLLSNNSELDTNEVLDPTSVYIGYKDRFLGICELPFYEFVPGGDIPFHRVYYFRTGGPPVSPFVGRDGEVKVREDNLPEGAVFIWDRESRTDLVFHSGNSTISI